MEIELLLAALKTDLNIRSDAYNDRLTDRLYEAQTDLTAQGLVLEDTAADRDLVIMYAAWLWSGRVSGDPMPRMLVTARNNKLFGRKAAGSAS